MCAEIICTNIVRTNDAVGLNTFFYLFFREKDLEAKFIIEMEGKKTTITNMKASAIQYLFVDECGTFSGTQGFHLERSVFCNLPVCLFLL